MSAATRLLGRLGGTPVLLVPRPGSPAVSLCVAVSSGSADDPEALPGMAHLLEHLASPQHTTANRPDASLLDLHGGRRNAVTLRELTVFTATVAKTEDHLAVLADELGRLGRGAVSHDDVLRETEIIALEAKGVAHQASAKLLWSTLPARALGLTELQLDGMGDPTLLAHADPGDIAVTLAERYRPQAMTAVLVGDVPPDAIEAALTVTPATPDVEVPQRETMLATEPVGVIDCEIGRLRGAVVLPVESAHKDAQRYLALLVVCRLLRRAGAGVHGAFVGVQGRWWATRHVDLVTVALFTDDGLDALRRDLSRPWPADEVSRAMAMVALDLGRSIESTALRAQQVATWEALVADHGPAQDLLTDPGPRTGAEVAALVDERACRAVGADLVAAIDDLVLLQEPWT